MSEVLGVIPDDGYTERGRLNGVPGLYPPVVFRWRPMLVNELSEFWQRSEGLKGVQLRQLMAAHVAGKLKEWDLRGPRQADGSEGDVLAITKEQVLRLKPVLFDKLFAIVSGTQAPDALLDRSPEEEAADLDDALKAAETGRPLAAIREERLRGNSPLQ